MKSDILGTEKISKLLFKQAWPAILGSMVFSAYMITDAIFIERAVGPLALAGVFVTFPIYTIMTSFSNMLGLGSASIISRALGAKDKEKVKKVFGNYFLLVLASGLFATFFGLLFLQLILNIFGATPGVFNYAFDYIKIMFAGALFFMFYDSSNALIRSEGGASFVMKSVVISSLLNVLLDYVFMMKFGWGVTGASLATLASAILGGTMNLWYFAHKETNLNFKDAHFSLNIPIIKDIFKIGLPTFSNQAIMSARTAILNRSLAFYGGDLAIAAFGILINIFIFLSIPLFGLAQALQPIVGYNYGAKFHKRVKETIVLSIQWGTIIMCLGTAITVIFANPLVGIFTKDIKLAEMTVFALIVFSVTNPLIAYQILSGGMFQALGQAKKALFMPMLRQLFILIPLILILPRFFGLNGVWFSFPVADILGAIIIGIILARELRRFDQLIEKEAQFL